MDKIITLYTSFLVSDDESEHENEEEEWEAQQIRKGVTGAQVTILSYSTIIIK